MQFKKNASVRVTGTVDFVDAEGLKPVAAVIQDETQKLANQAAN